jgi:hypothetical protein
MNRTAIATLAVCIAITGCKQGAKETSGQAAGTILPGSTSDAMIPLDQVRSEPPLAPAGSGEGTKKAGAKSSAGEAAGKTDAPAETADTPSAAASAAPTAAPTPETAAT